MDERNAALADSRKNAGEMVKKARAALEKDTLGAKLHWNNRPMCWPTR